MNLHYKWDTDIDWSNSKYLVCTKLHEFLPFIYGNCQMQRVKQKKSYRRKQYLLFNQSMSVSHL